MYEQNQTDSIARSFEIASFSFRSHANSTFVRRSFPSSSTSSSANDSKAASADDVLAFGQQKQKEEGGTIKQKLRHNSLNPKPPSLLGS